MGTCDRRATLPRSPEHVKQMRATAQESVGNQVKVYTGTVLSPFEPTGTQRVAINIVDSRDAEGSQDAGKVCLRPLCSNNSGCPISARLTTK